MKTIIAIITALFISIPAYAGEMTKTTAFSHSVTENGTIQVRLVTSYLDDGKLIDKKTGPPMTPADTTKMEAWDQESQDIVAAIEDKDVKTAFTAEKQEPTGTGLETVVTYDRTVDSLGRISVRRITRVFDDGVIVSKKFHRSWVMPGDDPVNADVISKAIAQKLHTLEVVTAYKDKQAVERVKRYNRRSKQKQEPFCRGTGR